MPVITLSRQIGSGGDDVARIVAERLALRLVGREIINQAARRAGVPEVALAELDELGLLGLKPCPSDCERYGAAVSELVGSLADEGDTLFLGRGSQVILAARPGVLKVRIVAPLALRIQRVGIDSGVPRDIAAALVETRDRARAAYMQRYYGRNADDPQLYDIVLNMAHLGPADAAELICRAAGQVRPLAIEVSA